MKLSAFSSLAVVMAAFGLAGCSKDNVAVPQTEFTLHMDNGALTNVGGTSLFTPLVLGSGVYQNANGDDFTVNILKYYISNVKLNKADGSSYAVPDSYFLVDQAEATTHDLTMTGAPVGDYASVSFVVGVDSARTKAGSFGTGVLNAGKGMFWPMNGGTGEFINFKLEGNSPQARTGALVFHVAGYQHSTTNTIRTVTVPFPSGTSLLIRADHQPEVHVRVDIPKMFGKALSATNQVAPVSFATTYNVMGGLPAVRIADNIAANVFSVDHIHAN